jgi:hypothetical protein
MSEIPFYPGERDELCELRELRADVERLRGLLVEVVDIAAGYVAGRMAPNGVRPNDNESRAADTWKRVMEISGLIAEGAK